MLKSVLAYFLASLLPICPVLMGLTFTKDTSLAKEKCCAIKIRNTVSSLLAVTDLEPLKLPCICLTDSEQMHLLMEVVGLADQFFASVIPGFDTSPYSDCYFISMLESLSMYKVLNTFVFHATGLYFREIASDLFDAVAKLANPPPVCNMSNKEQHKKGRTAARKAKSKAANALPAGTDLADTHRRYQHDTPKPSSMDTSCAGLRSERPFGVSWRVPALGIGNINFGPGDDSDDDEDEEGEELDSDYYD